MRRRRKARPAANLVTWQESVEDRIAWLEQMESDGYPVFVAVDDDEIIGGAAYFQFVTPAISWGTVENSVYVAPSARGNRQDRTTVVVKSSA